MNPNTTVEQSADRQAQATSFSRRLPIGAELSRDGGGAHFRVWVPACREVTLVLNHAARPMTREADGYYSLFVPQARAGDLYFFRLDGRDHPYPDPASRFQPKGPHGPSQIVDPDSFEWTDSGWKGVSASDQVLYEMHVGTFTPEGTWAAAAEKLGYLAETGITCLEVMPVAEFPGNFGWGYDGVDLFAPTRLYGTPDDFRRFVDRAHALGIGVILDVVYNHIGPDGNYLKSFSTDYFSTRHKTDWGEAINYDAKSSGPVREFVISNARYWISEFHLDGFRFDATQNIYDDSKDHILAAITRAAREAAGERQIYLIAENEPQETGVVRPQSRGGFGMDGLWNDDFHHSAVVRMTGHNEAYFADYLGKAGEFVAACKWGYLYQGQPYIHQGKRRGTPALDLPPTAFVNFIENHDQLANLAHGLRTRSLSSPGIYRAMTTLLLLAPQTPMLFQGQEFGATTPFMYFADHNEELARLVRKGRAEFMRQFPSHACEAMAAHLPDPSDPKVFERCKLDWNEAGRNSHVVALFRDLLRLRREDPVLRLRQPRGVDGAVLSEDVLVLRFFAPEPGEDRLLLVNLGSDFVCAPSPEPLMAPPEGREWRGVFMTEDPRYGGNGTSPLEDPEKGWRIPGQAAVLMNATAH